MTEINTNAHFHKLTYGKFEKVPNVFRSKGKYCIEVTYFNGGACFISGFINKNKQFYTLFGNAARPTNWHNGYSVLMNFQTIKEMSTYAVLIDLDSKIFKTIHGEEKYEYNFASEVEEGVEYSAMIEGGCGTGYSDAIWVNYGYHKFVNSIPNDFKPWATFRKVTCQIKHQNRRMLILITIIIIFIS